MFFVRAHGAPKKVPARRGIVIAGNLPPPVHGMAAVNAAVVEILKSRGFSPTVLNTSPRPGRSWLTRTQRFGKIATALRDLWSLGSGQGVLYLSAAGGYGQTYDVALVLLARVLGRVVLLHHHSYAYLRNRSSITSLLARAVGTNGLHIVLCRDMEDRLRRLYPKVANVLVLSNAAFVESEHKSPQQREALSRIGYISNVSAEKGIFTFLDVVKTLSHTKNGQSVQASVAGAFTGNDVKDLVMERIRRMPNVSYVGPRYDEEKAHFFSSIDVLLFPSTYENEAEPLTVLEALSHGIPVITTTRGCLAQIVPSRAGAVIPEGSSFVAAATQELVGWIANAQEFRARCVESRLHFESLKNSQREALAELLARLECGVLQTKAEPSDP